MDALTWFKSVFQRALTTPAPLRADVATEMWGDVPLHLAAARLRPATALAEADKDWDAVIARAKREAASPRAPIPPPLPPAAHGSPKAPSRPPARARDASRKAPSPPPLPPARHGSPEMQETPPPLPAQASTRSMPKPKGPRANLDLVAWGGPKKPAALRPAFAARPTAMADQITPPPTGRARRAIGPLFGPAKR